ncbi:MAG: KTSC domain-containing protein [Candidatus Lokiarchaeota archaeon]|nr:KTSC domain-containing protein [Candidatus Lokiarchaeota archaeon]
MKIEHTILTKVQSTNINFIGCNKSTHTMYVVFTNGARYKYFDIPEKIYLKVKNGEKRAKDGHYPSVGAAFDYYVKKRDYRYQRI